MNQLQIMFIILICSTFILGWILGYKTGTDEEKEFIGWLREKRIYNKR